MYYCISHTNRHLLPDCSCTIVYTWSLYIIYYSPNTLISCQTSYSLVYYILYMYIMYILHNYTHFIQQLYIQDLILYCSYSCIIIVQCLHFISKVIVVLIIFTYHQFDTGFIEHYCTSPFMQHAVSVKGINSPHDLPSN